MNNDLLYQIALTKIPNIGDVHAKTLIKIFKDASLIFKASKNQLEKIDGIGSVRASSIKSFRDFKSCEEEVSFIQKHNIQPLFIGSESYPQRLLNCYDAPVLLYYKGNADLNKQKIVSIVGTRNNTEYGRFICEKFIEDLKDHDVIIVSGLAYGIDTIAHKSALKNNLSTIAVLAHGLDRIYPPVNRNLAVQITEQGGLLTDFTSGTNPDKQNFPGRNRITAGICDALVVIETAKRGGSLITAEIANSYNKDVFAIPGRSTDAKSEGCNFLIKSNKACLISNAADLMHTMLWTEQNNINYKKQRELFIELNKEEKIIVEILNECRELDIDNLFLRSSLSNSIVAGALLSLEMNGMIESLPGKRYRLI